MAQFDVHRNQNPASAKMIPYLVDVQANLLEGLRTRVVVPLAKLDAIGKKPADTLNPIFEVAGKKYVFLAQEMAGIPLKNLGPGVVSLVAHRQEIIQALDVVFAGV